MAQYYASIQGSGGQATKMGTKKTGINGHIRGWHIGAQVWMSYNEETGEDECTINLTGGSRGSLVDKQLGTFTVKDIQ